MTPNRGPNRKQNDQGSWFVVVARLVERACGYPTTRLMTRQAAISWVVLATGFVSLALSLLAFVGGRTLTPSLNPVLVGVGMILAALSVIAIPLGLAICILASRGDVDQRRWVIPAMLGVLSLTAMGYLSSVVVVARAWFSHQDIREAQQRAAETIQVELRAAEAIKAEATSAIRRFRLDEVPPRPLDERASDEARAIAQRIEEFLADKPTSRRFTDELAKLMIQRATLLALAQDWGAYSSARHELKKLPNIHDKAVGIVDAVARIAFGEKAIPEQELTPPVLEALLAADRSWAAGDTAAAVAGYRTVIQLLDNSTHRKNPETAASLCVALCSAAFVLANDESVRDLAQSKALAARCAALADEHLSNSLMDLALRDSFKGYMFQSEQVLSIVAEQQSNWEVAKACAERAIAVGSELQQRKPSKRMGAALLELRDRVLRASGVNSQQGG